jgi:glycerol-3-phosphate dehydrogenase
MRLAFLNAQTTLDVLPRVVDIMAEELGWDSARKAKEIHDATHYLSSMGLPDWKLLSESSRSRFDPLELGKYRTAFGTVDRENDGHIEGSELLQLIKQLNLGVDDRVVAEGVKRAGVNASGSIEFFEFLEVLGRVKEIKEESNNKSTSSIQQPAKLTTERSGGGV